MFKQSCPIRVVIADPDPSTRHRLRGALNSQAFVHVIGEAIDGRRAVTLAGAVAADVLLMDLALCRDLEVNALAGELSRSSSLRLIVIVNTIDQASLLRAVQIGARGIVMKKSPSRAVLQSIRSVMAGSSWVASPAVHTLMEAVREILHQRADTHQPEDYSLTPREGEIVAMIASGRSNREVAAGYCISERTVKHHLTNIFRKIGITSRTQLVLFAIRHHLIHPSTRVHGGEHGGATVRPSSLLTASAGAQD